MKDLIIHLLDHDLDTEIEVPIESEVVGDTFGLKLQKKVWKDIPFEQLMIQLDDYVLLEKSEYKKMLEQLDEQK
ncbi:hypothetical protein HMPREF9372_3398 [Sporosarcina newyorkensis 2681]|uniref:Uncharacterized protein n=1 Tax=Sporosarcina newyorkensis 2681 TaxID=1027292 RepID=F9DX67_9BACL|nr:hypothetical protein HMPREF9372_3398 [Sporosarcina newyorkensis 2681]